MNQTASNTWEEDPCWRQSLVHKQRKESFGRVGDLLNQCQESCEQSMSKLRGDLAEVGSEQLLAG